MHRLLIAKMVTFVKLFTYLWTSRISTHIPNGFASPAGQGIATAFEKVMVQTTKKFLKSTAVARSVVKALVGTWTTHMPMIL